MKKLLITATAAFIAFGSSAMAASFTIVGGSADFIPGGAEGTQPVTPNNEVLDNLQIGTFNPTIGKNGGYELDGFGNGISIQMNVETKVLVEVLGWEASFDNSFTLDGTTVGKGLGGLSGAIQAFGDPLASFVTSDLSSLDFSFASGSTPGGTNKGGVANGDANTLPGQNFFASVVGNATGRHGNSLYIFYDDGDVIGDNHDDLVIRITAQVPLPAGGLLLVTGLGAAAALRRRKAA